MDFCDLRRLHADIGFWRREPHRRSRLLATDGHVHFNINQYY